MKPAPFEYHAPTSVDEALALLARYGDEAKPLAGGQSLVPLMAFRLAVFGQLIDLGRIEAIQGIRHDGDHLVIGAGTRQSAIERDETAGRLAPMLCEATRLIGHFQIRNRGTIGGSLAHADPAAEYAAVAVALDATVDVASTDGTRSLPAGELFDSAYTTTLEPHEIITAVRIPVRRDGHGVAVREVTRRSGDFALAGCAATVRLDGAPYPSEARVVLFGVAGRPVRLTPVEEALVAGPEDDLADLLVDAIADLDPPDDALATSRYRKTVARHIAEQAITDAIARAKQGGTRS